MAFVRCPNCKEMFSDKEDFCTYCGCSKEELLIIAFIRQQLWRIRFIDIKEDISKSGAINLSKNFYLSSYVCPSCNEPMHKTVFRNGEELPISVASPINPSGTLVKIFRMFTCSFCKKFYAPLPKERLSAGMIYELTNQKDYALLLEIFNSYGSTSGRTD